MPSTLCLRSVYNYALSNDALEPHTNAINPNIHITTLRYRISIKKLRYTILPRFILSPRKIHTQKSDKSLNYTYSIPEHEVQTNEPTVILIYVGPLW